MLRWVLWKKRHVRLSLMHGFCPAVEGPVPESLFGQGLKRVGSGVEATLHVFPPKDHSFVPMFDKN